MTEALKREEEQQWKNSNKISDLKEQLEFAKQTVIDYQARLQELTDEQQKFRDSLDTIGESGEKAAEGIERLANALTLEAWYEADQNAVLFGEKMDEIKGKTDNVKLSFDQWEEGAFIEATHNAILFGKTADEATAKATTGQMKASKATGVLSGQLTEAMFTGRKMGEVLHSMMVRFIADLVRATIEALALKAIMSALGGFGGIFGGIFEKGGMIPSAQRGMSRVPREMLIKAHPGEAVLTQRGVRAIGGPAGVEAINRGSVSISMMNNFGGINNIADVEAMAGLMGKRILTSIREAA